MNEDPRGYLTPFTSVTSRGLKHIKYIRPGRSGMGLDCGWLYGPTYYIRVSCYNKQISEIYSFTMEKLCLTVTEKVFQNLTHRSSEILARNTINKIIPKEITYTILS
jgi:hypothetical protein